MPYDIEERDGGYAVVHADTGEVALVDGVPQTGLDVQDADDLVDLLNLMESQKPARLN